MNNINLNVEGLADAKPFFTPTRIELTPSTDLQTHTTEFGFQLFDEEEASDELLAVGGAIARTISGKIKLPIEVAASIYNTDGSFNFNVINAVFATFGIKVKEEAPPVTEDDAQVIAANQKVIDDLIAKQNESKEAGVAVEESKK